MSNTELAKRLTDTLKSTFSRTLFNPWRDDCDDCKPCNSPDAKLARLAAHLPVNRILFFVAKRRVIAGADTAGSRLLVNVFF